MKKQMLELNESNRSLGKKSNKSMSKSLSRNSSKLGTRSQSMGSINKKNNMLPELKVDKNEPKVKYVDWSSILKNPFKVREMPNAN